MQEIKLNNSQQRVFDYLVNHGSITTLEANSFGETRISARIFELKEKGVLISDEMIKVKNRFGESRHVKRYFLG